MKISVETTIAAPIEKVWRAYTTPEDIKEWWLEPHTKGPGPHAHPEDDVFFVIDGTMSFLVDGKWVDAPKGSFVLVPGGSTHDFENRGSTRAGALNFSVPGNFEQEMPAIAQWFAEHPPGHAGD